MSCRCVRVDHILLIEKTIKGLIRSHPPDILSPYVSTEGTASEQDLNCYTTSFIDAIVDSPERLAEITKQINATSAFDELPLPLDTLTEDERAHYLDHATACVDRSADTSSLETSDFDVELSDDEIDELIAGYQTCISDISAQRDLWELLVLAELFDIANEDKGQAINQVASLCSDSLLRPFFMLALLSDPESGITRDQAQCIVDLMLGSDMVSWVWSDPDALTDSDMVELFSECATEVIEQEFTSALIADGATEEQAQCVLGIINEAGGFTEFVQTDTAPNLDIVALERCGYRFPS
ncbi:MAG: hypothetical protein KTU85_12620 [Acidimicrobiia bacterium]|nr:hypothetical protein [Acidimicrobiia bacterium]